MTRRGSLVDLINLIAVLWLNVLSWTVWSIATPVFVNTGHFGGRHGCPRVNWNGFGDWEVSVLDERIARAAPLVCSTTLYLDLVFHTWHAMTPWCADASALESSMGLWWNQEKDGGAGRLAMQMLMVQVVIWWSALIVPWKHKHSLSYTYGKIMLTTMRLVFFFWILAIFF